MSREEVFKAEDLKDYYRIPADTRDLNYGEYFAEGETTLSDIEDYTSHNTVSLMLSRQKNPFEIKLHSRGNKCLK